MYEVSFERHYFMLCDEDLTLFSLQTNTYGKGGCRIFIWWGGGEESATKI